MEWVWFVSGVGAELSWLVRLPSMVSCVGYRPEAHMLHSFPFQSSLSLFHFNSFPLYLPLCCSATKERASRLICWIGKEKLICFFIDEVDWVWVRGPCGLERITHSLFYYQLNSHPQLARFGLALPLLHSQFHQSTISLGVEREIGLIDWSCSFSLFFIKLIL